MLPSQAAPVWAQDALRPDELPRAYLMYCGSRSVEMDRHIVDWMYASSVWKEAAAGDRRKADQ
jgi:hypothetical protein